MAVVSAVESWRGSLGGKEWGRGGHHLAIWRVITNSALDQSLTVLTWFFDNRVALGDQYTYANDVWSEPVVSLVPIAKRIYTERELASDNVWLVFVEYNADTEELDDEGNPTDYPLDFRARISETTVQYGKALTKATYLSGFTGNAALLWPNGSEGPVHNSAGTPVLPPPEVDDSRVVVRISRNAAFVSATDHDEMINAVNLTGFVISHFGYERVVPARCARIREIGVGLDRANGTDFWVREVMLDINPDTWLLKLYDMGIAARATAGDPDGNGGTVSGKDIAAGQPEQRQILDRDGTPITDPIPLNGDGQPLPVGVDPVQLTYIQYPKQRDFRSFTFFSGLIS